MIDWKYELALGFAIGTVVILAAAACMYTFALLT